MAAEADIESKAVKRAKERGWLEIKIRLSNINGWPDRILCRRGRVMFVEFKAPGERPSVQQSRRHDELREQDIEVHWVDNLEDAYALLD